MKGKKIQGSTRGLFFSICEYRCQINRRSVFQRTLLNAPSQTHTHTPGEASPGAGQGTEDGSEGQSRKERVEGEVEQSLHPVIAQAFQRVNIILRNRDRKSKKT